MKEKKERKKKYQKERKKKKKAKEEKQIFALKISLKLMLSLLNPLLIVV